jgi:hypothetical protein
MKIKKLMNSSPRKIMMMQITPSNLPHSAMKLQNGGDR